jgi:ribosomal RNA-processing protein 9
VCCSVLIIMLFVADSVSASGLRVSVTTYAAAHSLSFDISRPPPTRRTRDHRISVTSSDERFLFASGNEGFIIKRDLRTGTRHATLTMLRPGVGKASKKGTIAETPGHVDEVLTIALSDDGV